jgi:hypothetical protein
LTIQEVAGALGIDLSPSRLVTTDERQLDRIAEQVLSRPDFRNATPARWDDPLFWNVEGSLEERSQYLTIGNAINFRFWRLNAGQLIGAAGTIGGKQFRGSMYMWRCLRRCVDDATFPLLDAKFLAQINDDQFNRIFRDDSGDNPLQIAGRDRIANLRDLGRQLLANWGGQFYQVLEASRRSLVEFAKLSKTIRAFDDPIYKLTMVNAILHSGSGVFSFKENLLPGIDYELVRQLLRQGVVRPCNELERKLSRFIRLKASEAYELRRIAMSALIQLSQRTGLKGDVLDNRYWWNRVMCTESSPVCLRTAEAASCPFYPSCEQHVGLHRPIEITRYY